MECNVVDKMFECYTAMTFRKKKKRKTNKVSPITVAYLTRKAGTWKRSHISRLKVLFDSGSDATIISAPKVKGLTKKKTPKTVWKTKAGTFTTNSQCELNMKFPAFFENKEVSWNVFVEPERNELGRYDLIIGRDMMLQLGIDLLFSKEKITWEGAEVGMQHPAFLDEERWVDLLEKEILYAQDPLTIEADKIQAIVDSKYVKADLEKVVEEQSHLSKKEQKQLLKLLKKFEPLFDGTVGAWKTEPIELELKDPGCTPYHARPYPVPQSQEQKLRAEVERLVRYGVLRKINRSEWACPMFTIPKPDGSLRSLADLRELNKRIKKKPYPLPKISEMLHKLEGFMYATSIDLNMGYYHIMLTPRSARLCTIVLPWGKYEYVRLLMGLCNAPDIFQEKMNTLMEGLEFARAYIDDLLVLSKDGFETHLEHLEKVFNRLSEANLKVNIQKCKFCQPELEYLGYMISRDGVRPIMKKVQAIQQIGPPKTRKQLRRFIGMINYYRDVWPMRAHTLAPLSKLTSKNVPYRWKKEHQEAFEEMKRIITKETLLAYLNFNKPFHIHTDASDVQLGACISQEGKPIAFYSRKLNPAQTRYTTTEQELLSIVETCKEFRTILMGQQLIIHTDHKNLTHKNLTSDRVLRWRLYIEEYSPEIVYVKGEHNVVADALTRLDKTEDPVDLSKEFFYLTCYGNEKTTQVEMYPLSYKHLEIEQQRDKQIKKILQMENTKYEIQDFHGGGKIWSLVCYKEKIVVPGVLRRHVIDWYHTMLCHPGINRTEETIAQHLWWPDMRGQIRQFCNKCKICQKNKRDQRKFGLLPPKEAEAVPWDKRCIDLIGPYKIRRKRKEDLICKCVTMIDPATGWFEIHQYDDKRAITIANIAEQEWLCRYPWPTQVTFDRGSEFMGEEFKRMLSEQYGIKKNL